MGFVGMFLVFVIFLAIILTIFFVVGLILLIIGLIKNKKNSTKNKKTPKILIIIGTILISIPISLVALFALLNAISSLNTKIDGIKYKTEVDKWKNRKFTHHDYDDDFKELINNIITFSNNKDKELMMSLFSNKIINSRKEELEKKVDNFLNNYPQKLSNFTLDDGGVTCPAEYGMGKVRQVCGGGFELYNGNERYYFNINYVYRDDFEKDNIGIEYLELVSAQFIATEGYSRSAKEKELKLIYIDTKKDPELKIIYFDNYPTIINDLNSSISYDKAINTLNNMKYFSDFSNIYGEPNAIKYYHNPDEEILYYKLKDYEEKDAFLEIDSNSYRICIKENNNEHIDNYSCNY